VIRVTAALPAPPFLFRLALARVLPAASLDHQVFEQLEVLGKQLVVTLDRCSDQLSQRIDGLEQNRRERCGQHHRAGTKTIEDVLDAVREPGQRGKAEPCRVALDRVRGAEDRLQRLFVLRCGFELDEPDFHLAEVLLRLGAEDLQQLDAVDVVRFH